MKEQRTMHNTTMDKNVASMEQRAQYYADKREARLSAAKEKKQLEQDKRKRQETARFDKMVNTKTPESARLMTKSAKNRANMVRFSFVFV